MVRQRPRSRRRSSQSTGHLSGSTFLAAGIRTYMRAFVGLPLRAHIDRYGDQRRYDSTI